MQLVNRQDLKNAVFWKYPKFLLGQKFADLDNDCRTAYMLLRDRLGLSLKHGWLDHQGRPYVICTCRELAGLLHVGKNKASKVKQKLAGAGLISVKKQGFSPRSKKNLPDLLYILQPEKVRSTEIGHRENADASSARGRSKLSLRCPQRGTNKDTLIKTNIDTKSDTRADLDNYSKAQMQEQSRDLLKHASEWLKDCFIGQESLKVLSLWCKTPKELLDAVAITAQAARASRKEAQRQVGYSELVFEQRGGMAQKAVASCLRRFFAQVCVKKEKMGNPKGYLYSSMLDTLNKAQNQAMQSNRQNTKTGLALV